MVKNISTTVWIISFRLNKLNLSELIECCSGESAFSHINKKTCPDIRQSKNIFLLTPPRQKLQLWQRGKNGEVSGNNFSAYNVRSNDIVCISRFAGESDSPTHAERGRLMEEKACDIRNGKDIYYGVRSTFDYYHLHNPECKYFHSHSVVFRTTNRVTRLLCKIITT